MTRKILFEEQQKLLAKEAKSEKSEKNISPKSNKQNSPMNETPPFPNRSISAIRRDALR